MKSPVLASLQEALKLVKAGELGKASETIQQAFKANHNIKTPPPFEGFRPRTPEPESPTSPIPPYARFIIKTFTNQYGSRDYKLYIPSTYQDQPLPLIIMLHGCTQNPDDFALGTQMNQLAEQKGLLVAYPQQPQGANPNRCWNWFRPQDQHKNEGEPSIIAGLTQAIMNEYLVKGQQVYIAGISAGGAMAAILAARYPELYRAVGVHSGLGMGSAQDLPSALMAMGCGSKPEALKQFVPTIIFHGDFDKTVALKNGEYLFEQAKKAYQLKDEYFELKTQTQNPTNSHAYTRTTLQNSKGVSQIEYWVIQGAGHAWAGGNKQGSYTDPKGPNASWEMVRFFLER